jgi:hypothetical protein
VEKEASMQINLLRQPYLTLSIGKPVKDQLIVSAFRLVALQASRTNICQQISISSELQGYCICTPPTQHVAFASQIGTLEIKPLTGWSVSSPLRCVLSAAIMAQ